MRPLTSGALLDAVRGVHWPARRITRGIAHGAHRSKRVGASPEFREYRPYQQGDDPAKIDWKLFARTERVAIRLAHDDARLPTTVLVDASASMAFPEPALDKWQLAASVALGLTAVAHGDGDPIGLAIAVGESARVLPPRTRRGTVSNTLRLLLETTPSGATPLAPVLRTVAGRRVAIISDMLGDADATLSVARELIADGREVVLVHVVATAERDPGSAPKVVVDPENATIRRPLDEGGLADYRRAFGEFCRTLADAWRASGAQYLLALTDEPAERVVRRVVQPV